ncbi:MAG TPA: ROK family protein [Kiritimatiellia bacterium]|jgi:glucokinase
MKKDGEIRYAVGIDFGGTSVKMALVDDHGEIKGRKKIATNTIQSQELWLKTVAASVEEMKEKIPSGSKFCGVGVGVPGFVDHERGFIYELPNVPGWKGVHLSELLGSRLACRVRVDNDVNAMALGECTFGAGRTYQHAVFVTLGTGVGGGLLINKSLYRGAFSMAGEIGHMTIDMNGIKSPQGKGGLEQYIGNRRLVERVVREMEGGRASALDTMCKGDRSAITVQMIGIAARAGDGLAQETFDFLGDCLAAAFSAVTYLLQPQAFIVGGGISENGPTLFDPLRKHLGERLTRVFADRIEIKAAELVNDAGVIGCATLAFLD